MKNVPSLSEVDLLDGYYLLCHRCLAFLIFLIFGIIVHFGWRIM